MRVAELREGEAGGCRILCGLGSRVDRRVAAADESGDEGGGDEAGSGHSAQFDEGALVHGAGLPVEFLSGCP